MTKYATLLLAAGVLQAIAETAPRRLIALPIEPIVLLDPYSITRYVQKITKPPTAQPAEGSVGGAAKYRIEMRLIQARLHPDFNLTSAYA